MKTIESFGGVVGLATAPGGFTRNPTFAMPEFWIARTSMGMDRFCDATAPAVGDIRVTWSAWTFDRKMVSVSAAKLPRPSVARAMIVMLPPLPEFTEREGVGDAVRSDRAMKHRVEHTVEATAEYEVDA